MSMNPPRISNATIDLRINGLLKILLGRTTAHPKIRIDAAMAKSIAKAEANYSPSNFHFDKQKPFQPN